MKNIFIGTFLFAAVSTVAQTNVEKVVPTKASGEGIIYSLPKTSLIINVEVTKVTVKAGPYYKYAERYLGVKDVANEDKTYYELGKIAVVNKGIPDSDNTYKIEFKQKTVAPYAYLTVDGLLCAINAEYEPEADTSEKEIKSNRKAETSVASLYSEELLMAGSIAKQAEVAAKQIYAFRESKNDILTGETENMPKDGEAMKLVIGKLEEQEQALTKLFVGSEMRETSYFDVSVVPEDELNKEIVFRFSSKLGILDVDDLGGEPVYMTLIAIDRAPELDPKEAEKKEKSLKGIVYNNPGKARVELVFNNKTVVKKDVDIVQFGTRECLAPVLFEDKKQPVKVLFYPELGAIKQITQ